MILQFAHQMCARKSRANPAKPGKISGTFSTKRVKNDIPTAGRCSRIGQIRNERRMSGDRFEAGLVDSRADLGTKHQEIPACGRAPNPTPDRGPHGTNTGGWLLQVQDTCKLHEVTLLVHSPGFSISSTGFTLSRFHGLRSPLPAVSSVGYTSRVDSGYLRLASSPVNMWVLDLLRWCYLRRSSFVPRLVPSASAWYTFNEHR